MGHHSGLYCDRCSVWHEPEEAESIPFPEADPEYYSIGTNPPPLEQSMLTPGCDYDDIGSDAQTATLRFRCACVLQNVAFSFCTTATFSFCTTATSRFRFAQLQRHVFVLHNCNVAVTFCTTATWRFRNNCNCNVTFSFCTTATFSLCTTATSRFRFA